MGEREGEHRPTLRDRLEEVLEDLARAARPPHPADP
jgi:hypothetical protein